MTVGHCAGVGGETVLMNERESCDQTGRALRTGDAIGLCLADRLRRRFAADFLRRSASYRIAADRRSFVTVTVQMLGRGSGLDHLAGVRATWIFTLCVGVSVERMSGARAERVDRAARAVFHVKRPRRLRHRRPSNAELEPPRSDAPCPPWSLPGGSLLGVRLAPRSLQGCSDFASIAHFRFKPWPGRPAVRSTRLATHGCASVTVGGLRFQRDWSRPPTPARVGVRCQKWWVSPAHRRTPEPPRSPVLTARSCAHHASSSCSGTVDNSWSPNDIRVPTFGGRPKARGSPR